MSTNRNPLALAMGSVKIAYIKACFNSPIGSKKRYRITFNRISPLVVVNTSSFFKRYFRYFLRFFNFKDFVRLTNIFNGVAGHLRANARDNIPNFKVTKMVQGDSIPASIFDRKRDDLIACFSETLLSIEQRIVLFFRSNKLDRNCLFHIGYNNINKELKQTNRSEVSSPWINPGVSTSSIR